MENNIYENRKLTIYRDGIKNDAEHSVVKEMPLTIMLNGEELATLVCSPYSLDILAVGFLVSEGLLNKPEHVKEISCRPEQGVLWIETEDCTQQISGFLKRNFASCCGKGRPSLHFLNDYEQLQPLTYNVKFTVKEILRFAQLLDESSDTFRLTGGVHEAALAYKGELLISYNDIGRHNALDRILGYTFLNNIDTSDKAIILSGRVASEMLTKAARIGVSVVVSRSATTSLSIDLAEQLGITIVGFARGNGLNVYTHPERIIWE